MKVSQGQSNCLFLRLHQVIKKGFADLRTPVMNSIKGVRQQLYTVMLWEFLPYLSLLKMIPET